MTRLTGPHPVVAGQGRWAKKGSNGAGARSLGKARGARALGKKVWQGRWGGQGQKCGAKTLGKGTGAGCVGQRAQD